jgi:hypothetical protein
VRKRWAIAAVIAMGLVAPAGASASAYSQVLQTYQATGTVPACRFTSAQLEAALHGIDSYGQQYLAEFGNAVQSALTQRASGGCTRGVHVLATAAAPQAPLPATATSPTDGNVPLPMLLLAGLALVVALAGGGIAIARSQGWEPSWAAAWRHAWAEAGFRMSGALSDAADRWRRR